jgi:tetratricopeptide (TPR) repeat protein
MPMFATRFYLAEGELLIEADANDEALALYNRALREHPEEPDLLYGRSLVHERLKDMRAAEADLRQILKDDADDARAMNALGYMLTVHTDRLDEARKLVTRALEITPEDAAAIDSLGWIEFRQGRHGEARRLLEKAFSKVKDPEIAAHLGEVLWTLGARDEARAIWEAALTRDPDHRVLRDTVQRLTR